MLRDLAFSWKSLRHRPKVVLFVVLPLALGIGANTAIFTVVEEVLLAPLQFPESHALYVLDQDLPKLGGDAQFSSANFLDLRQRNRAFEALTAMQPERFTLTERGDPVQLAVTRVTPEFFEVFRTLPAEGRRFLDEDVAAHPQGVVLDHAPLALLSDRLWRARFGGRPDVVGETLMLDGRPHEIVGVMPPEFFYPDGTEVWVPLLFGSVAPIDRGGFYLQVVGRLSADVSESQARANLGEVAAGFAEEVPQFFADMRIRSVPLQEALVQDLRWNLWILFAVSSVVLLVVCANVAHYLLAHAVSRRRDIAVRMALGSGRTPIVRQLLFESLLLAGLGSAAGLLLARFMLSWLILLAPPNLPGLDSLSLDPGIFVFAAALTVLTAVIFGLAPALYLARVNVRGQLVEGGSRGSTGSRRHRRVQAGLIALQLALALVLVNGALLLTRSFANARSVELGFEADRLVAVDLMLPEQRYPGGEPLRAFVRQALERLDGLPGVEGAAAGVRLPVLDGAGGVWFQHEPGHGGGEQASHPATFNPVTPDYFETLGIGVARGRAFADDDHAGGQPVAVISQSLAEAFFPDSDPLGRYLVLTPWPDTQRQIVGVVADVRQGGVKQGFEPAVYVPYNQLPFHRVRLAVRTERAPDAFLGQIRAAVWQVDPDLGIEAVDSMENRLAEQLEQDRLSASLVGLFGILGLVLAASGIYANAAYFVEQRLPEFGIRQALGGRPRDLVLFSLRSAAVFVGAGLVLGLAATLGLARFAESLLFEVSPHDPLVLTLTVGFLCVVGLGAMLAPALRAARVDPAQVLHRG